MRNQTLRGMCWVLTAIMVMGCGSKSTGPGDGGNGGTKGTVITGEQTQVAAQTMGSGGGTVRVEKTGDSLDGLEINVPAGALSENMNIAVSEAAVTSHSLGTNVRVISPLITVKNVSGYASEPITVKIPVNVPEGSLAMGVLYDETTGKIEGLPLLELTATSMTVALRTFVPSPAPSASVGIFKALGRQETAVAGNIMVVSVEESALTANPVISTGFTPGVDDWEFINRGSYIAPGGLCAGQSISAMWYFYEKKLKGSPRLYQQFDRVHDSREVLWQDNPRGYRFASTVQKDIDWDTLSFKLFEALESPQTQSLGWKCFALSMFLTGEPQLVGLTSDKGGHAIIAYQIDYANGILYVADPNYPGQERKIHFNGIQFDPYSTKQNDTEPSEHPYTGIGYYAKSALAEWDRIGARWQELENATIGNDRFPKYRLWVTDDDGGHELEPSEVVTADSILVQVQWENGAIDNRVAMTVFDGAGTKLAPPAFDMSSKVVTIRLEPGENVLGFHIWGDKGVSPSMNWRWLDFQWVPVIYSSLRIEPKSPAGKKNEEITLTAISGSPPDNAKYLWDFGDGKPEVSVLNKTQIKHTYTADGDYTVTLRLYDVTPKPEKLMGTATATVKIGAYKGDVQYPSTLLGISPPNGWAYVTERLSVSVEADFQSTDINNFYIKGNVPLEYAIYVDGSLVHEGVLMLEPQYGGVVAQGDTIVDIGFLSEGKHIIRLVLDPNLKITDTTLQYYQQTRIREREYTISKKSS